MCDNIGEPWNMMLRSQLQKTTYCMTSFLYKMSRDKLIYRESRLVVATSPWIQGKEHKILNVLPNIVF